VSGPLLVFGAGGQVGRELMALAATRGVPAVGITRAEADISDPAAVGALVSAHRPSLIVNAAAYTAVDKAESEPENAAIGNVDGPGTLADAAAQAGVAILHISTDYVFDGTKTGAYDERDPIAPLGVYGQTKADGEARVRAATARHVILRTAWVYGTYGNNFLKTMLRLAAERDQLRVVGDQYGCPTSTRDIAEAILAVHATLSKGDDVHGTYHFAGTGDTSWHGFADAVVQAQALQTGKRPPVAAIATSDYPTPAKRPANSRLDSTLFATTFGYRALPWQARVTETVADLMAATA
jgi:dTDP-4-dehydrorhamnose reductase